MREARPDEPVRAGIVSPARLNAVRTRKYFFCGPPVKKDCSARPDDSVRTGIARPLAAAAWAHPYKNINNQAALKKESQYQN